MRPSGFLSKFAHPKKTNSSVLLGSSAINGLYLNRPGEIEVNAWQDMLEDMEGADNWSWESLSAAMMRSETFTEPTKAIAQEAAITWNPSDHGSAGPIHVSYPGWYDDRPP